MLERYVTAAELAELLGVSLRTVKAWTSEGMPSESWGMRVRRYQPSAAIAWARNRGTMAAAKQPGGRANAAGLERKE